MVHDTKSIGGDCAGDNSSSDGDECGDIQPIRQQKMR